MRVGRIAVHDITAFGHSHGFAIVGEAEGRTARPAMPFVDAPGERHRRNRLVHAARGRHVTIGLTESNDAAVARATQEQQVRGIWRGIVRCFDAFVSGDFVAGCGASPFVRVVLLQPVRIGAERVPNLDKWREDVGGDCAARSQRPQHGTAAEKGIEVRAEPGGEI